MGSFEERRSLDISCVQLVWSGQVAYTPTLNHATMRIVARNQCASLAQILHATNISHKMEVAPTKYCGGLGRQNGGSVATKVKFRYSEVEEHEAWCMKFTVANHIHDTKVLGMFSIRGCINQLSAKSLSKVRFPLATPSCFVNSSDDLQIHAHSSPPIRLQLLIAVQVVKIKVGA